MPLIPTVKRLRQEGHDSRSASTTYKILIKKKENKVMKTHTDEINKMTTFLRIVTFSIICWVLFWEHGE